MRTQRPLTGSGSHFSMRRHARRGQTAIIVALGLVLFMSCTALAVDGARFYAEGLRVQKAADEAALAAVVRFSSTNDPAAGQTSANDLVARNLPVAAGTHVTVSASSSNSPVNQESVVVQEQNFPFLFAPVLGLKSATITRQAKAQYNAPVPMGNPSNTLGKPDATINTYQPGPNGAPGTGTTAPVAQNLTLSVNGPDQWFESGDPYSPLYVLSDPPFVTGAPSIRNPYYPQNPNGYDYKVTIPSGSSGATYIQVYDAETCHGDAMGDAALSGKYGLPYTSNGAGILGDGYNQATYFSLYRVDPATGQKGPVPTGLGNPLVARGPAGGAYPPNVVIAAKTGVNGWSGSWSCDPTFRDKWYTLAKVDAVQGGSYIVNATTCLNSGGATPVDMYASANKNATAGLGTYYCRGTEVNNFALRAVTSGATGLSAAQVNCDGSTAPTADPLDCQTIAANGSGTPSVAGMGRISVQVQSPGTSLIYLAKVDPIYAGKWLLVKLFDPGDLVGTSSMQIVRPDGSYAPFMWYTETLDGNGTPFQTGLRGIANNTSLITSFPSAFTPAYSAPTAGCPSADAGLSPSGAIAYGQTVAEDNPFDPNYGANAACVGADDHQSWGTQPNQPPTPPWLSAANAYQSYNLSPEWTNNNCQPNGTQPGTGGSPCQSNYRVYDGRWVYLFTQIPADYATNPCRDGSGVGAPACGSSTAINPNPRWWYVRYNTASTSSFTDRTTWETAIIDTPPHLIQ